MRKKGLDLRAVLSLLALVVIAGGVALLTVGGSSAQDAAKKQAKAENFDAAGAAHRP